MTIQPGQSEVFQRYLGGLPSSNTICHMDFQPGNIMLTKEGYKGGKQKSLTG